MSLLLLGVGGIGGGAPPTPDSGVFWANSFWHTSFWSDQFWY